MAYIISSGKSSDGIILNSDSLSVLDGGIANNTTANSGGRIFVSSGGTANNTTVNSGSWLYLSGGTGNITEVNGGGIWILSGGLANNTTVNYGTIGISNGGMASNTTVNNSGDIWLLHSGTINKATVNCSGWINVSSGGTANSVTVNSGGHLRVFLGGLANSATVNSGGWLDVSSGGTATMIKENGGYVYSANGADVFFIPNVISGLILSEAIATVHLGTTANSITVNSSGFLIICSGGLANSATVNSGGSFHVDSGGLANSTTINSGGTLSLAGIVNNTTVNSRGRFYVDSDGTANSTTVNSDGIFHVHSGGIANSTSINSGGWLNVSSGGTANCTTVISGGSFHVDSGGIANSTSINSGGWLNVSSGGTATNIVLTNGAHLVFSVISGTFIQGTLDGKAFEMKDAVLSDYTVNKALNLGIQSGGTANNTTVNAGGCLNVSSGGTACGATVNSGGWLDVFSGGLADSAMVCGGDVRVNSGGTANNTTVNSGGTLFINSGMANSTTVNSGGDMSVYSGMANNTTVNNCGSISILSGATANNVSIFSGASMLVSGGAVDTPTVNSGGTLSVVSGMANSPTVESGGMMSIYDDGTVNNAIVNGGALWVASGVTVNSVNINNCGRTTIADSRLSGCITVEAGSELILDQYTVLDFDLTQSLPENTALVNGFSRIAGDPSYTLTVGRDQPIGIYQLARNVYEFDKTISLIDVFGTDLGVLSVGQTVNSNNLSYTLILNNSALFLSIREEGPDKIAPAVFSVMQSHINPTVRPVTVTAEFADDVKLKSSLYRIGENGAWTDYTGGVTVTENTTVYFKAVDTSGNESEVVAYSVTNIEEHPNAPVFVYLDFDGGQTTYFNRDLDISFTVSVENPGFSDSQKRTILDELVEKYAADGVVFTLTRPDNTEYSTLYFGKSDAFAAYGEYFGISETLDNCNRSKNDNAFVLLDSSYSVRQTVSVAETALDHILGLTFSQKDVLQMRDYAINPYLMSTQWDQRDPYNKFCPIDPDTGERSATGCASTAASQIIYYWLETGLLDLSLALDDSDRAFLKTDNIRISSDPLTAEQYDYLSFDETNELLANFKLGDIDSIAALCFAVGVAGISHYSSLTTSGGSTALSVRSGFKDNTDIILDVFKKGSKLTDAEDIMIREVLAGRPLVASIYTGYSAHDIVIDGYDSSTDKFHTNFGWGAGIDGWDSLESLRKNYSIYGWNIGNRPEVFPDLSMSELSLEQDAVKQGNDVVINLSLSNSGKVKTSESMAYVCCGETLLSSQVLDFLYSGETRVFSLTVDSSKLSLGANTITVTVDSPDTEAVLGASLTIDVYESVVSNMQSFTGDFDGGGKAMLAVEKDSAVKIYANGAAWGNGLVLDPGWDIAGVGDFDGDGADDILHVHSSGLVIGEISDGYGEFSPQVLNFRSAGWSILGTGDFNHNGTDDVLIANPTGASDTVGLLGYWESGVTWTLINGYSAEWECIATGDFDGDGKCDMLWRNSFVGDGGLTYNAYCTWIVDPPSGQSDWRMVSVANPAEWDFLCSGDFDGNGSHDIAMINGEGVVGIWGISDGYLNSWSILSAVDPSVWALAGVGDFNGDKTDDIAWSNIDTGLTGYWQINNKALTTWQNIAVLA